MATSFKDLDVASDVKTTTTSLSQLVDIVQQDISGSSTRKQYSIFVTASSDSNQTYAVTSSLFQTVYDQDYSLQVANPMFDMTVGLYWSGSTNLSASTGITDGGKYLYSSSSMMMREKVDMYRMFAGKLLGDTESSFFSPINENTETARIDDALFLSFKRLFVRDGIRRNSFAMRFYTTGAFDGASGFHTSIVNGYTGSNLDITSPSGSAVFTDSTLSSNLATRPGGTVGTLVDSANTDNSVGLIWYDAGIAVLDLKKICFASQHMSGTISAVTGSTSPALTNQTVIGSSLDGCNPNAVLIPDLMVSASMDDLVNYFASTRIQSGSLTGITFQNQTNVNSMLLFCRATSDEFNYSNNPTYFDETNNLVVMENQTGDSARPFTCPTGIGLYDNQNRLLAVAKFSRPILKDETQDLTIRVRLDF